jgi:hypothetical protein
MKDIASKLLSLGFFDLDKAGTMIAEMCIYVNENY